MKLYYLGLESVTYITISFLVELLEIYSMACFSSGIGSVAFTMFWNMVLFLCDEMADSQTN